MQRILGELLWRWRHEVIFGMGDESQPSVGVRMVTYKSNKYVLVWWNQYSREVKKGRKRHIDTWLNLKREIDRGLCLPPMLRTYIINCRECTKGPKV
ncbi:hypothetical protein CR513_44048, partial [Mucuna pruriens]